jgi:imidazoleglycerol phosphate dehydratase HisB
VTALRLDGTEVVRLGDETLHADDPHHAWEAAFRAFGRALRSSLAPNTWRSGLTAGVKGTLD